MKKYARSGCRERSLHRAIAIPHTGAGRWGRAGGDQQKADPKIPKGLDLFGPCPPALVKGVAGSSWDMPSPTSSEKAIMSAPPTLTSLVPPPRQNPSLFPPATQHSSHIYLLTPQGPTSSYALKTSAGRNTLLALPHKAQVLTVLATRGPSPHCLHTLQLPASTFPLEWGKRPLPTPSDYKLISVLWG